MICLIFTIITATLESLTSLVLTKKIQLVPEFVCLFLSEKQVTAITAIQEMLKTLWVASKYGVGLIKKLNL